MIAYSDNAKCVTSESCFYCPARYACDARRYLGVYLMGARDAAVKFADIYSRTQDRGAKSDFMMLLTDLEESFGQKTEKLLLDNNADLSVEIEVLRDRLQREGVRPS